MVVVALPPDRPNIFLKVEHRLSYNIDRDLKWVVDGLREKKLNYPKTVIFCNSVMTVFDVYAFIKVSLGKDAFVGGHTHAHRLVSMYHGEIGTGLQNYTLQTFGNKDTVLRVLISTIAFGMGVEVSDIRRVVHWGKSKTLLSHWQEVGRAGRDGEPAEAIWYPMHISGTDKLVFQQMKDNKNVCLRKMILDYFVLPGKMGTLQLTEQVPCLGQCLECLCTLCRCCSYCRASCRCHIG